MEVKLYIILVNWNKPQLTVDCIRSIYKSRFSDFKIVVVDNGSLDNSIEVLTNSGLNFHFIKSFENLGYTGGNNLGINFAISEGAEFILLLNNDTLIDEHALTNLITPLINDPLIGITQPKIYFYPDISLIWSGPTRFNKFLLRPKLLGYKQKNNNLLDQRVYLDYAVGCATLIRSTLFAKVGLLDDDYFAVCEDVDFGLKVRAEGSKILYVPESIIYHKESASAGGADHPAYVYYQSRSYLILFSKQSANPIQFTIAFIVYFISSIIRIIRFLLSGKFLGIIAIIFGFRDFLLKRYGKREYSIFQKSK